MNPGKCVTSLVMASAVTLSTSVLADQKKDADLSSYSDGDPIVLSGTIQSVEEDEITLNYGGKKLEVEFTEWPWEGRDMASLFSKGQKVTVSGQVDKDWLSSNEVEANNIYLDDQYVYYYWIDSAPAYSVSIDQNSGNGSSVSNAGNEGNEESVSEMEDGAFFSASGEITSIDDREFTLNSGEDKFTVDTMDLDYNPMDGTGLQQLSIGDRVYVIGNVDDEFFSGKELSADAIVTLKDASDMSQKKQTEEVAKY